MVKNEIRKRSMEAQGITPPPQGPPGPVPGHVRPGGPHGFRPGVPGGHGPPGGPQLRPPAGPPGRLLGKLGVGPRTCPL